jgi:hypothetical protein
MDVFCRLFYSTPAVIHIHTYGLLLLTTTIRHNRGCGLIAWDSAWAPEFVPAITLVHSIPTVAVVDCMVGGVVGIEDANDVDTTVRMT